MPELDGEGQQQNQHEDAQEEEPQKFMDSLEEEEVKAPIQSFYHCKAVDEEDPNYLLKAMVLRPEKAYIPTFLRGEAEQLTEED